MFKLRTTFRKIDFVHHDVLVVFAMSLFYVLFVVNSHSRLSVGCDERAHLAAGVAIHRLGCLDLYSVNGPLIPALTTLPWAADAKIDQVYSLSSDAQERPEFQAGHQLIMRNSKVFQKQLRVSRTVLLVFGVLGVFGCWLFGRSLGGKTTGAVAAYLWCVEPNILGHSSIVGTDVPAAAIGAWICFSAVRFIQAPTINKAVFCGLLIGVAVLIKPLWIIGLVLYPLVVGTLFLCSRKHSMRSSLTWTCSGVLVSLLTINAGYGFQDSFRNLGQFAFASPLLSAIPIEDASEINSLNRANRFHGSILEFVPIPLPSTLVLGMDLQATQFARDGLKRERTGAKPFFPNGPRWRSCYYFYLVAFCMKSNLSFMISLAISAVLIFREKLLQIQGAIPGVLSLILFLWVSLASSSDGHYRYLFVALPGLFVIIGIGVASCGRKMTLAFAALLFASFVETCVTYPFGISQVNWLFGGISSSHKFMCGTNVDYGTGWLEASRYGETIAIPAFLEDFYYRTELQAIGIVDPSIEAATARVRLVSADTGRYTPAQNVLFGGQNSRIVAGCLFVEFMQSLEK